MKTTLRHVAYQNIKRKIIYFELKPGEKILESKTARMLNIGRVPVREALAMLENEKLITKTNGYGYQITKFNEAELDDYFNIRAKLEHIGAELLIERADDSDISKMKKHLEKALIIYQQDNSQKIIESDTKFHELMYLSTKSDVFFQTISSLSDKTIIMRAAAMMTQKGRESSITDHVKILKSIEKKELNTLKDLLFEHLKFAPNYYKSIHPFGFL